jgi:hypothetical protein
MFNFFILSIAKFALLIFQFAMIPFLVEDPKFSQSVKASEGIHLFMGH